MIFKFRKQQRDPDRVVYERWKTDFKWYRQKRFAAEETGSYKAEIQRHSFMLSLKRKNLFAWALEGDYKYRDFFIDADISFGQENGHSAAGFVLRYVNEENFYYFMLSNRAMFRFDVVFNGNPVRLIEWTENPLITRGVNRIRLIADGSHFSFYIDDEWVAEIEDETVYQGYIGFAGQNFNDRAPASFYLNSYLIDSKPAEVEKMYLRWAKYIPAEPEFRINLAKTFIAMSDNTFSYLEPAAVQIKKALVYKRNIPEYFVLYAQVLMRLKLYDDALKEAERALKIDPDQDDALIIKAHLLYLLRRYSEARDFIKGICERFKDNAMLRNILGNTQYALGNMEEALKAYKQAEEIEPENTLFTVNEARCLEMLRENGKALNKYRDASLLLLKKEEYDELSAVLTRMQHIDPKSNATMGLKAKIHYFEGREEAAEDIFNLLIKKKTEDSSIYYLSGMIHAKRGDREQAVKLYEKAVEIEPDFAPYRFKLAESKFLLNRDPVHELKEAYRIAPDDPWINNLYGLYFLKQDNPDMAEDYLHKAFETAPGEIDILINYSGFLFKKGKLDDASALLRKNLKDNPDNARLHNQLGNMFVRKHEYQNAVYEYEKTLRIDKDNVSYLENCASACIKNDMISRAEELAVKLLDLTGSPSAYNIIGTVARIKGEYRRAEMSFLEGLRIEKDNEVLKLSLAELYLKRLDVEKALRLTEEILDKNSASHTARTLLNNIHKRYMKELSCSICGKNWRVPTNITPQPSLRVIGDVPDEAPAGRCNSCGRIYCVKCASGYIKGKRFTCPGCGEYLKFPDDSLRYLLKGYLTKHTV